MAKSKLRWGALGAARINDRVFPSFARAEHAELVGIASRDLQKAQAVAKKYGLPKAYGSYDDILADPDIDVIYNPLPNHLHGEWTKKAADGGKSVLCEKPLAPTAAEAAEIVAHCRRKKVKLMDGFMWPHHPRTAKLRQMLDNGAIGDVQKVVASFSFHMNPLDPNNIRLKPETGGGSLLDLGCYAVYGIRWAFRQEPVKVFAAARFEYGVDVAMDGVLWFAGGQTALFDCAFTLPLRKRMEIVGSKGLIYIPKMWLPDDDASFYVHTEPLDVERVTVPGEDQIAHMLDNLSRAVRDDTPITPDPEEAVKSLRVMDALAESARRGVAVEVAKSA